MCLKHFTFWIRQTLMKPSVNAFPEDISFFYGHKEKRSKQISRRCRSSEGKSIVLNPNKILIDFILQVITFIILRVNGQLKYTTCSILAFSNWYNTNESICSNNFWVRKRFSTFKTPFWKVFSRHNGIVVRLKEVI